MALSVDGFGDLGVALPEGKALEFYNWLNNTSNAVSNSSIANMYTFIREMAGTLPISGQTRDVASNWPLIPPSGTSDLPHGPVAPELSFQDVADPQRPTFAGVELPSLEIDAFNVAVPDISIPAVPDVAWPASPDAAPAMDDIVLPSTPIVSLPPVPVFSPITLPDAPDLGVVVFEGERPDLSFDPPGNLFVYNEESYSSSLQTALQKSILDSVQAGGTGLSVEAQAAIWQPARDRAREDLQRQLDEISAMYAGNGAWGLSGPELAAMRQARGEYNRKTNEINQQIFAKQAEMAWEQSHRIITEAIAFVKDEVSAWNATKDRTYQAQKTLAEIGLQVFRARLDGYTLWLEQYKADAAIFEARIRANLSLLEVYKARMEGAKLQSDIQRANVELYKSQLSGVQIQIDVYKSQLEGAKILSEVQVARLSAYKAEIDAYATQVQANKSRFDAYAAQITGEKTKAEVYKEQVDAYGRYVEAKKAEADAHATRANVTISQNKLSLEQYGTDIDKYKADMADIVQRARVIVERFGGEASVFGHTMSGTVGRDDSRMRGYTAEIQAKTNQAQAILEDAKNSLQADIETAKVRLEALSSGAKTMGQVAAAGLGQQGSHLAIGYSESVSSDAGERLSVSVGVTG